MVGALALAVAWHTHFRLGEVPEQEADLRDVLRRVGEGNQIGSPATFRGVKIGEVTDIGLRFNPKDTSVLIAGLHRNRP